MPSGPGALASVSLLLPATPSCPQFPKPPSCLTQCLADRSFGCVRTGQQTPCAGGELFCDPSFVVQSGSPEAQKARCVLSVMGLSIVSPNSGLTPELPESVPSLAAPSPGQNQFQGF